MQYVGLKHLWERSHSWYRGRGGSLGTNHIAGQPYLCKQKHETQQLQHPGLVTGPVQSLKRDHTHMIGFPFQPGHQKEVVGNKPLDNYKYTKLPNSVIILEAPRHDSLQSVETTRFR